MRRGVSAAVAVVAVLAGGCGSLATKTASTTAGSARAVVLSRSQGTRATSPAALARVASAFASYFAHLYVANNEPPTPPRVDAMRRAISVSCRQPVSGQYPCTVSLRHASVPSARSGFPLGCVAFADRNDRVTNARCAGGPGFPPPVTRSGYVDCRKVGRVVSITAASGDISVLRLGKLVARVHAPWADLVGVRVAASSSALCIDFATAAPPRSGTRLILGAINEHTTNSLLRTIDPEIDFVAPVPEIELFANTPMSGQVGQSGDWTSWFATTQDIGSTWAPFLRAPFQFEASTTFDEVVHGGVLELTDTAPAAPRMISYP